MCVCLCVWSNRAPVYARPTDDWPGEKSDLHIDAEFCSRRKYTIGGVEEALQTNLDNRWLVDCCRGRLEESFSVEDWG